MRHMGRFFEVGHVQLIPFLKNLALMTVLWVDTLPNLTPMNNVKPTGSPAWMKIEARVEVAVTKPCDRERTFGSV